MSSRDLVTATPYSKVAVSSDPGSGIVAEHLSNTTSSQPTRTPCTMRGDAAQRVFNLPELLGNILLQLPDSEEPWGAFGNEHPAPVAQYFILQRVNKSFQAVIERNKSIQRRMFLLPHRAGTELDALSMIIWLIHEIGISQQGFAFYTDEYGDKATLDIREEELPHRPQDKRVQASWRKIRFHCVEGGSMYHRVFLQRFKMDFPPEKDLTLGHVHAQLRGFLPTVIMCEHVWKKNCTAGYHVTNPAEVRRADECLKKAVAQIGRLPR